jgi:hypothetical protein
MIYRLIPLLLFALALSASCTIRKRVHTGGYYIQWHKRHPQTKGHKETKELPPVATVDSAAVEKTEDTLVHAPVAVEEPVTDTIVHDPAAETEQPEKVAKVPKEKRPFEPLGVLAAKLLGLPVLAGILKDNSKDHQQEYMLGIAFLFLLAVCFFLGIVSMIYYLREPEIYRFNIWAIFAIIVPLFLFILLLTDAADL